MSADRPIPPPPPARAPATGAARANLPPPTGARPAIQAPKVGEAMSQASKDAIANVALGLLEEQIQARIVHYKADLETNPELDAITASVVAQLRQMQQQAGGGGGRSQDQLHTVMQQQERTLAGLLAKLYPPGAPSLIIEKRIKSILRNLARLFFQSELHERTRGEEGRTKVIQHGEQAMFYLLTRYHHRMLNEIEHFDYISDDIRERSVELLHKLTKDMQDGFLARRSNELKRIVGAFSAMLIDFAAKDLSTALPALAPELVRASTGQDGKGYGYKIVQSAFGGFRAAFERGVMPRLVSFAEDELVRRLADTAGSSRDETLKFITNPEIFSMILVELESGTYEYLCNEGFLDLPPEWVSASA